MRLTPLARREHGLLDLLGRQVVVVGQGLDRFAGIDAVGDGCRACTAAAHHRAAKGNARVDRNGPRRALHVGVRAHRELSPVPFHALEAAFEPSAHRQLALRHGQVHSQGDPPRRPGYRPRSHRRSAQRRRPHRSGRLHAELLGRQPPGIAPRGTDRDRPRRPLHAPGVQTVASLRPPRCTRRRPACLPAYIAASARLSSSSALLPSSGAIA